MKPIRLAFNPETGELILNPGNRAKRTTIRLAKRSRVLLAGLIEEGQNMWTDAQRAAVPMESNH